MHYSTANSPWRILLPVGMGTALSLIGDSALYTVLPTHTVTAGIALASVGILLSANRIIRIIANFVAGWTSDRISKRIVFIFSMFLGAFSTAVYGLTYGFPWLLAGRLLWGIAWAGIWVAGNGLILDAAPVPERGRWVGRYHFFFFLGAALGAALGGILTDRIGYHSAMIIAALLTLTGALIALFFLRPSLPPEPVEGESVEGESVEAPSSNPDFDKLSLPTKSPTEPVEAPFAEPVEASPPNSDFDKLSLPTKSPTEPVEAPLAEPVEASSSVVRRPSSTTRHSPPATRPKNNWSELLSATAVQGLNRLVIAGILASTFALFLQDMLGENISIGSTIIGVATVTGILSAARIILGMVFTPTIGSISDRAKTRWQVVAGGLLPGIIGFALLAVNLPLAMLFGLPLTSITGSSNQSLSTALIGDLGQRGKHGRYLGLLYTAGDVGSAIGPLLAFAILPIWGISALYWLNAVLFGLLLILALYWARRKQRMPTLQRSIT